MTLFIFATCHLVTAYNHVPLVMKRKYMYPMKLLTACLLASSVFWTVVADARSSAPFGEEGLIEAAAIYLDNRMEPVDAENEAFYYAEMVEETSKGFHFQVFFLTGELKMDGWYADAEMTIPQGYFTYYYRSGQVESEGEYRDGAKYGIWNRFDHNGEPKPERVYAFIPMMKAIGVIK